MGTQQPHQPSGKPLSAASTVGIRALKQNASEVVSRAAAGATITITDRGRPVAQLVPLREGRVESLTDAGRIKAPTGQIAEYFAMKKLLDTADPARSAPTVQSAELLREQREDRL